MSASGQSKSGTFSRYHASIPERLPLHEDRLGSLGLLAPLAGGLGLGPEGKRDRDHDHQRTDPCRDRADRQGCPRRRAGFACRRGGAARGEVIIVGTRRRAAAAGTDLGKEDRAERLEEAGDEERRRGVQPITHRPGQLRAPNRGEVHQRHRSGELRRGDRRRRDPHEEGEERHRQERQAGFVDSKP